MSAPAYTCAEPEFIEVNGYEVMAYRYGPAKLLHVSGAPVVPEHRGGVKVAVKVIEHVERDGWMSDPTRPATKPVRRWCGTREAYALGYAERVHAKSDLVVLWRCKCGNKGRHTVSEWRRMCASQSQRAGCKRCKAKSAAEREARSLVLQVGRLQSKDIRITAPFERNDPRGRHRQ